MGDFEKCPVVKCVIVKVISQNPHPFEECTKVFPKLRIFALRGSSSSNRRPDPFANFLKFSPMSWLSVWESTHHFVVKSWYYVNMHMEDLLGSGFTIRLSDTDPVSR